MIFNLKINTAKSVTKFKSNSSLIIFCDEKISRKQFDENLTGLGTIASKKLYDKFKSDKISVLSINREEAAPDLIRIVKTKKDDLTVDFFRDYLAGFIESLSADTIENLVISIPEYKDYSDLFDSESYFIQTIIEGIKLGNYDFVKYKSKKEKAGKLDVTVVYTNNSLLNKVLTKTNKLFDSVYFARDLINEPAITLTPAELAKRAKAGLTKVGVNVTVFNKKQLQQKKMGAILAVGSASTNDPCLIIAHYKPKVKAKKKIALVGKGVTYDTGGLSLKPTSGMIDMKVDMAGGAVALSTLRAAAELKLPLEIIAVVPAVENSVSGNSYKPGDIIKTASGKSIYVKDTDAEGRIILADALEYASKQKPDEIIDFATLTGACVVALGEYAAGLFTNYDALADDLYKSGMKTFERVWRLPFWKDFNKQIKSDIADVANLGTRWGGAITAGKFLENFVDENIPWAHLDIAGPACHNDMTNYTKKWETGFGVRLMVDYLESKV